ALERVSEHADQLRSPSLQSVHARSEGPVVAVGAILLDSQAARETDFSETASKVSLPRASMPASNTSTRSATSVYCQEGVLKDPGNGRRLDCRSATAGARSLAHRLTPSRRFSRIGIRVRRIRHGRHADADRARAR